MSPRKHSNWVLETKIIGVNHLIILNWRKHGMAPMVGRLRRWGKGRAATACGP